MADLHSLCNLYYENNDDVNEKIDIKEFSYDMTSILLASGLDLDRTNLFLQSSVPMHSELYWYLSSIVPHHWLNKMIQYKTKKKRGSTVGLYTYPILMAADIVLYNPEFVPVGHD